jgi:hypothetical protein
MVVDLSLTDLVLPPPSGGNTGGYKYNLKPNTPPVFVYSPIDLAIAGVESVLNPLGHKIKNLSRWFRDDYKQLSDHYVFVLLVNDGSVDPISIAHLKLKKEYKKLMALNAPFTFKGVKYDN